MSITYVTDSRFQDKTRNQTPFGGYYFGGISLEGITYRKDVIFQDQNGNPTSLYEYYVL